MVGKTFVVLIALVALAPVAVLAGASPTEHLVSHLQLDSDGLIFHSVKAEGNLSALQQDAFDGAPLAPENFTIHAPFVRMETDRAESALSSLVALNAGGATEIEEFVNATFAGFANRPGHSMTVLPAAQTSVNLSGGCTEIGPSNREKITTHRFVDAEREPYEQSTDRSLQGGPCESNAEVEFVGDFLVTLWEWDTELVTHDGQTRYLETGHRPSETAPELYPQMTEARQIWLFVKNGKFSATLAGGSSLFLEDLTTRTEHVVLRHATGSLSNNGLATIVSGNRVELQGDLELSTLNTQNRLTTVGKGTIQSVKSDDQLVDIGPSDGQERPGLFPLSFWWVLLPIAILGGVFFAQSVHPPILSLLEAHRSSTGSVHPRRNWLNHRIEGRRILGAHCEIRGWRRLAIWHYTKVLHLKSSHLDALVARGNLYREIGQYRAALRDYGNAQVLLPDDAPEERVVENTLGAARAATLAGQPELALSWLRLALEAEPCAVEEISEEATFIDLRGDSRFQLLLAKGQRLCKKRYEGFMT